MTWPKISLNTDLSQLIYAIVVIVLVPAVLTFNSFFLLKSVQKDLDYELNNKALLVESVLAPVVLEKINNPPALQSELGNLISRLPEIKAIEIFQPDHDNLVPTVSTSAGVKKGADSVLNQLAWSSNKPYSKQITVVNGKSRERVWLVAAPIYDGNTKVGLINLYLSAAQIDALSRNTMRDSLAVLVILMVFVLLLLFNHFRFFETSILFRQLSELDKLKDDFISMASHELRAPLTAISGYAYLLLKNPVVKRDPKVNKYISVIFASTERLKVLVEEILDVSRIEQKRMKFTMIYNDLVGIVESVVNEFAVQAQTKGLQLTYLKPAYPMVVFCDRDKMHQIFANLVSNAIKYTPTGEVAIYHQIQEGDIRTFVKDTGVGMSKDERSRLFSKFYRVYNSKTQNVQGTGLGLWITKSLVEKMGGQITVDSIENHGSQFIISFRLRSPKTLNVVTPQVVTKNV